MRFIDLLLPALITAFFYGLLPIAGIVITRISWYRFRSRFFFLRRCPELDYTAYRQNTGGIHQFSGVFDSFAGERKIFIENSNLQLNADLTSADIYLLLEKRMPEKLNLNKLPILERGLQVFVGGKLQSGDGEPCLSTFGAEKLFVIFYDKIEKYPTDLVCNCGRQGTYYWNPVTFYSYIAGTFLLMIYVLQFLLRPAYRLILVSSIAFALTPFLTLLPPGLLLTMLSRKFFAESMKRRIKKDLLHWHEVRVELPSASRAANWLEILSWLFLIAGGAVNGFFILLVLNMVL